jgi:hypothetical protein
LSRDDNGEFTEMIGVLSWQQSLVEIGRGGAAQVRTLTDADEEFAWQTREVRTTFEGVAIRDGEAVRISP